MSLAPHSILVTGATGQLGNALVNLLGDRAIPCGRDEWDLAAPQTIDALLARRRPAAVINCAAYTQVDKAEAEVETAYAINAVAVEHLAAACRRHACALVQISTDYLFGGASLGRPWRESDPPTPTSVYARSKLAGEFAAQACPAHFIVRTCGLYGGGPTRVSFVEKMLQLAQTRTTLSIVDDQRCTPSLVDDVARAVAFLLETQAYGTYHIVNEGDATWRDFATEIFSITGQPLELQPISTAQFNAPAARPAYSVLDTHKYRQLGGPALRPWRLALAAYLRRRGT